LSISLKIRQLVQLLVLCIGSALLYGAATNDAVSQTSIHCRESVKGFSDRVNFVSNIERLIMDVTTGIEAIPPDIQRYIMSEKQASLNSGSRERLQILRSNQFFSSYELRDSALKFAEKITAAKLATDAREYAIALVDALERQVRFSESFDEYLEFDRKRSSPVLNPEKVRYLQVSALLARTLLSRELKCAISEIRKS
jgi:hypothetical protein